MTKISIIVPYRNAAKWLDRCCTSLTENPGEFEFIMIDGGSNDFGPEIVRSYADKDDRFIMARNDLVGSGVGGSRNIGLDLASGEWITFLDADDYIVNNTYYSFINAIKYEANIHQFNHLRYYPELDIVKEKYKNDARFYSISELPKSWQMVWNKLIRSEFLGGIRFVEGVNYGEDELFVLECLARDKKILNHDRPSVVHCLDNKSSLSRIKTERQLIRLSRLLEGYIKRHKDPELRRAVCLILSEHWRSKTYLDIFSQV